MLTGQMQDCCQEFAGHGQEKQVLCLVMCTGRWEWQIKHKKLKNKIKLVLKIKIKVKIEN
jgi:hypothetical protein